MHTAVVTAAAAHDAEQPRRAIVAKGAVAVLPNNLSRARTYPRDKQL